MGFTICILTNSESAPRTRFRIYPSHGQRSSFLHTAPNTLVELHPCTMQPQCDSLSLCLGTDTKCADPHPIQMAPSKRRAGTTPQERSAKRMQSAHSSATILDVLSSGSTPSASPSNASPESSPMHQSRPVLLRHHDQGLRQTSPEQLLEIKISNVISSMCSCSSKQSSDGTAWATVGWHSAMQTDQLQRAREDGCQTVATLSCISLVSMRTAAHAMLLWTSFLKAFAADFEKQPLPGAGACPTSNQDQFDSVEDATAFILMVPIACFQLACKTWETFAPRSSELISLLKDDSLTLGQVETCFSTHLLLEAELLVLTVLGWDITMMLPVDNIERLLDNHPLMPPNGIVALVKAFSHPDKGMPD